ncbi:hypothetical protein HM1_0625 [Heliomicrobium modesticaldum Ice1]|uniref:Uncharacterized protein n=1 Tax=Heliobacterium modesticaldum (strain ATCC 51547 / Ice1) TaxID=498761 RepID=B0TGG9_HELMI|nr:hypothetical protein HM1_0625 [Heliomicrobium modesticaldum Ice1]
MPYYLSILSRRTRPHFKRKPISAGEKTVHAFHKAVKEIFIEFLHISPAGKIAIDLLGR